MVRRTAALVALTFALLLVPALAHADTYVEKPAPGTPEATVQKAFTAALAKNFKAYLKTVHSENKETSIQRKEREKYEWKRFSKLAGNYLKTTDPPTFYVTKSEINGDRARLFIKDLKNADRMPVPVRLKKDGAAWGITANSL